MESFHFLEEHSDVTYQGGFTTILAEDSEENSIRRRVRQVCEQGLRTHTLCYNSHQALLQTTHTDVL